MGVFDLTCLSTDKSSPRLSFGGMSRITPGIYAAVECAYFSQDDALDSGIFSPIYKKYIPSNPQMSQRREFFLADIEAIVDTVAVIPDIGCPNKNAYFLLQQRGNWAKMFDSWLELPHETIDLHQLEDFFSSDEEEDTSDGE